MGAAAFCHFHARQIIIFGACMMLYCIVPQGSCCLSIEVSCFIAVSGAVCASYVAAVQAVAAAHAAAADCMLLVHDCCLSCCSAAVGGMGVPVVLVLLLFNSCFPKLVGFSRASGVPRHAKKDSIRQPAQRLNAVFTHLRLDIFHILFWRSGNTQRADIYYHLRQNICPLHRVM
jgi:hypothetical protein